MLSHGRLGDDDRAHPRLVLLPEVVTGLDAVIQEATVVLPFDGVLVERQEEFAIAQRHLKQSSLTIGFTKACNALSEQTNDENIKCLRDMLADMRGLAFPPGTDAASAGITAAKAIRRRSIELAPAKRLATDVTEFMKCACKASSMPDGELSNFISLAKIIEEVLDTNGLMETVSSAAGVPDSAFIVEIKNLSQSFSKRIEALSKVLEKNTDSDVVPMFADFQPRATNVGDETFQLFSTVSKEITEASKADFQRELEVVRKRMHGFKDDRK